MIELGRYQIDHLPREIRLCLLCKLNQVESETHFLFHCTVCGPWSASFRNDKIFREEKKYVE